MLITNDQSYCHVFIVTVSLLDAIVEVLEIYMKIQYLRQVDKAFSI